MSIVFDQSYFQGNRPDGYTQYGPALWGTAWSFDGFAQTTQAKALAKGFDVTGRKVLIVGCAFGYGVEALLALGGDVYGLELVQWAVDQAPASVAGRMVQGDARTQAGINAAKTAAGLRKNQDFDLIISEDLLTCLTDADAQAAAQLWRANAAQVAHRVSTWPSLADNGYTLHTLAEWRALLGPQDWLWDYFGWTEG